MVIYDETVIEDEMKAFINLLGDAILSSDLRGFP
jgi:hypothetical protein